MAQVFGIAVCLVLLSIFASQAAAAKRMVCYFGSWSVYRQNGGKFDVEDINPNLCTHLMFGFVGLSAEPGIRVLDPWNELYADYGKGAFVRFNNLRLRSPGLKTLVAIGGWNEGSIKYSQAFGSAANRQIFAQNAVAFIKQYGFDGLDLDWEYPGQRGGAASDKEAFTELIKTLRTEFDKHGYLLTAAVAAAEFSMIQSYDVQALSTYLDFINVMTYDFHGAWESVTGHNAPLYGAAVEVGTESEGLNIDASIKTWLKYGAPADKLVMGVGLYGRTFTLASTSCTLPRCAMASPGWAGPTTGEQGILGYSEICKMEPTSVVNYDEEAQVPYLIKGSQWVSYDNLRSVQTKVNYILDNQLGGAMVWSVDTDDAKGDCGNGFFPLLTLLSNGVRQGINTGSLSPVQTTPAPITTTTLPTTVALTSTLPGVTAAPIESSTYLTEATTVASPITTVATNVAPTAKKMVCYFGSWSVYRQNGGKFDVEDINPNLCTHLMFGFVGLSAEPGIRVLDPWNELYADYGKGAFARFNNLRLRSPGLKTLVAIGGWNEGSIKYSQAFGSAANRQIFAQNAVAFIKQYGFDGLDLDWEYPGQRGGAASDKEAFTELIKTLRAEFDKHGFLLTAAVAAAEFSMIQSYDVKALSTYLDFINVMTYDFHGAWESVTGHNAPLYGAAIERGTESEGLNIDASIKTWLKYGAPADKLVMGVGLYGRTFTLASTSCTLPRCAMSSPGWAGPTTGEQGILGYSEICKMESTSVVNYDEEAQVPYLIKGNQWVSYDNLRSVQTKVNYILDNQLGGAMVWSVDTDDAKGDCGNGFFPLLTLLSNGVRQGINTGGASTVAPIVASSTTTVAPTVASTTVAPTAAPTTTTVASTTTSVAPTVASTTTTVAPTTSAPTTASSTTTVAPVPSSTPCTRTGYIRDATQCNVFYVCTLYNDVYKYSTFKCSGTLVFDAAKNVCNYPQSVVC